MGWCNLVCGVAGIYVQGHKGIHCGHMCRLVQLCAACAVGICAGAAGPSAVCAVGIYIVYICAGVGLVLQGVLGISICTHIEALKICRNMLHACLSHPKCLHGCMRSNHVEYCLTNPNPKLRKIHSPQYFVLRPLSCPYVFIGARGIQKNYQN